MLPYAYILVWAIPLIDALLMPIASKIKYGREIFSSVAAILSFIFAFSMLFDIPPEPEFIYISWVPSLHLSLVIMIDGVSVFVANIVSFISALVVIYSKDYMAHEEGLTRYYFFINLFIGAMLGLVMAGNLLQMFIFWEVVGLCSYSLIGFWNKLDKNVHAGTKAFIVTRAGDVALLGAILIIYFYARTFDLNVLMHTTDWIVALASVGLLTVVPILAFIGAAGKSAQVPLQVWLPEAMAGPTTVSALIHAATMVKAGVYFVARVLPIFYLALAYEHNVNVFFTAVAWIGAFTAFLAASQGMVARELKKILAYSTISQLGYMMLALGAAGYAAEMAYSAFMAGTFHLMAHAIFKALLFLCAGAILHETGTKFVHEMGGLKDSMPITYKTMLIGGLSLAGIPPFAGYFSKELIFSTLFEIELWPIFVIAAVSAIMTVFYTFRMIGLVFFGEKSDYLKKLEAAGKHIHEAPLVMTVPLMILALFSVISGFFAPVFEQFFETQLAVLGFAGIHDVLVVFQEFLVHSFTAPTTLITVVIIVIGFVPAYMLYIKRTLDAEKIVSSNPLLKGVYTFLYNRWYINDIYYLVVRCTFSAGRRIRKIQTGQVNVNIIGMLLGFIAFLLYFILFM